MSIKLISKAPHKKYVASISNLQQVKKLCVLLRKQKDRQLEVVINGNSTKFNSIAGRKRFVSGFECAFKIALDKSDLILSARHNALQQEAQAAKHQLNEMSKQYMAKYAVMNIRKATWEDYIAELEDDRVILKTALDKLKRPKIIKKRKPYKKKNKKNVSAKVNSRK